jgi:hypothetical protein
MEDSSPEDDADCKRRCSGSITIMNSICDNGSPCLKPVKCLYHYPLHPLSRTAVDAVARSVVTQPRHLWPKPYCSNTSARKSQRTLSKALAMSSFKNKPGCLPLCSARIRFWVYKKLSWILILLMKALCALETRSFSSGVSLLAKHLENSFAMLWVKPIGL